MKAPLHADLAPEYTRRFLQLMPEAGRVKEIDATIARIMAFKTRYESVANKLPRPPWYVIALIHMREADLNFHCHLHNGDPLTARTVHEPPGRPLTGAPIFRWEDSAWDALRYDHLDKLPYGSIADICWALEDYNGWGYRGHQCPAPYLWAASDQYARGKFVADGVFNTVAVDGQLGAITVLKRMIDQHFVSLPGLKTEPFRQAQGPEPAEVAGMESNRQVVMNI